METTKPPDQYYGRDNNTEESQESRLERLGRERPAKFKTAWEEFGFCYSVVMSQVLTEYFVSGFNIVLPTVAEDLNVPRATQTWPANAFSLVISCFLLTFGRFADMYGGFPVYIAGVSWLAVWALIAGFSQNELMLDFTRAIQGFGPAAYLPSSLMLLGSVYRPGPRKNIIFSVYGACAPLGFYLGIFFAGKYVALREISPILIHLDRPDSSVHNMAMVFLHWSDPRC
jgi:MFS family permease